MAHCKNVMSFNKMHKELTSKLTKKKFNEHTPIFHFIYSFFHKQLSQNIINKINKDVRHKSLLTSKGVVLVHIVHMKSTLIYIRQF
jgi:transcriptional regulator CtsR